MNHRITVCIILPAFVSLAVFGFAAMLGEMGGETHGACLASLANGGCPMPASGTALAIFHVSAFKTFSSGILTFAFLLVIVFTVLALSPHFKVARIRWRLFAKTTARRFLNFESVILQVRDWLTSLEKRDPAFAN